MSTTRLFHPKTSSWRPAHQAILQRSALGGGGAFSAPAVVHDVLSSSGQALDAGTRAYMESRFGHDFSQVRIHTDAQAAESAQAVNALAYTVGRDVVFAKDRYAPTTGEGRKLLAHELVHVAQQAGVQGPPVRIGPASGPLEHEADRLAERALGPQTPEIAAPPRWNVGQAPVQSNTAVARPAGSGPSVATLCRQPNPAAASSPGGLSIWERLYLQVKEAYLANEVETRCGGMRLLERLERDAPTPQEKEAQLEERQGHIKMLMKSERELEEIQERAKRGVPNPDDQMKEASIRMMLVAGRSVLLESDLAPGEMGPSTLQGWQERTQCELATTRLAIVRKALGIREPGSLLKR